MRPQAMSRHNAFSKNAFAPGIAPAGVERKKE